MRVGLRERRREAQRGGGEHHRPGDVAAGAEDDVGSAAGAGSRGRRRGAAPARSSARTSAGEGWRGKAADPEDVELVAGLRDEPRLDPIRRPGERHEHSPLAQRVRYCERGQDVPCRPAGRDHAPKLSVALPLHAMLRRIPTEASRTTRLEPP